MRMLLLELRPAALAETRLEDLLRQLGEAASGREGIPVNVQVEGQADLPPDVHIALYRITQEALNNVLKHSQAKEMWLRLTVQGAQVQIEVEDRGRGFDASAVAAAGNGLGNMKSRLTESGGRMHLESAPGQGTRIRFVFELPGRGAPNLGS